MIQTCWIIYNKEDAEENQAYINWFINEAARQNINLTLVLRENIEIGMKDGTLICQVNRQLTSLPDIAIVRTIDPLLSFHLETMGMTVFNSSFISRICNNKILTHIEMTKLNIPMTDTLYMQNGHMPQSAPMPFPFVMKDAGSRGGKDVFLITNQNEWRKHRDAFSSKQMIIQSAEVQYGKDIRVFIVGKKVFGAVLRKNESDFRANFKLGGSASWYPLNTNEVQLIEKIVNHFDFGMVGIDFLIGLDGRLLLNEIEDVVGSRTLSAVSDKNIVREYITHIKKETARD